MGQQSNKIIKRRRRADYLKRKKEQAKLGGIAKKPSVKKEAVAKKPVAKKAAVKKAPAKKAAKKPETAPAEAVLEEGVVAETAPAPEVETGAAAPEASADQ
jgi:hypothetical protein